MHLPSITVCAAFLALNTAAYQIFFGCSDRVLALQFATKEISYLDMVASLKMEPVWLGPSNYSCFRSYETFAVVGGFDGEAAPSDKYLVVSTEASHCHHYYCRRLVDSSVDRSFLVQVPHFKLKDTYYYAVERSVNYSDARSWCHDTLTIRASNNAAFNDIPSISSRRFCPDSLPDGKFWIKFKNEKDESRQQFLLAKKGGRCKLNKADRFSADATHVLCQYTPKGSTMSSLTIQ